MTGRACLGPTGGRSRPSTSSRSACVSRTSPSASNLARLESFAGRIDGGDYDVIHPDLIEQARQNHPGVAEAAAADSFVRFAVIYGGLTPRLATMWLYRQQVWDLRTSPAEAD